MNTPNTNRTRRTSPGPRAFTLIEVLVVIGIIAILAGLLMPAYSAVRTRVKRQRALVEIRQMITGIQAFHSDVTRWPVFLVEYSTDWVVTDYRNRGYSAQDLTNFFLECADLPMTETALLRLRTGFGQDVRNYLSLDNTNLITASIGPSNSTTRVLADPWGNPYFWRFDYDANGRIPNPLESSTTVLVRASVLIWSAGPDKIATTAGENSPANRDNLKSW